MCGERKEMEKQWRGVLKSAFAGKKDDWEQ
jgi:hypothetical protein